MKGCCVMFLFIKILKNFEKHSIENQTDSYNHINTKSINFNLSVKSNYPSWQVDTDEVECENVEFENIKRVY